MNKSPINQFFESLEICFFASNLRKKNQNLEKTPKIFFVLKDKWSTSWIRVYKKKEGASDLQFCGVHQNFRNCSSFKVSWKKWSNSGIDLWYWNLSFCQSFVKEQHKSYHTIGTLLPRCYQHISNQLQSSTEVKRTWVVCSLQ